MKKTNHKKVFDEIRTRFGLVIVVGEDGELCRVFIEQEDAMVPDRSDMIKDPEAMLPFTTQITLYLDGKLTRFDLPIRLAGTPFQNRVWSELLKIPYGETRSYQDIAKAAQSPSASRAVGSACGKNPIAIVVPCHRVITSGGKLGGYSGGLDVKKALLGLEGLVF